MHQWLIISSPVGVQSIVISASVCLLVCLSVHSHISKTTRPNFTIHVTCVRSSVFLWQQCNTLCTSGFVDDVMFSHRP